MVKSCVAVGFANCSEKGSKLSFYRFPADSERRLKWIAAVQRKNWEPTKCSWICSAHFVSGRKSEDPLSPDYVLSLLGMYQVQQNEEKQRNLMIIVREEESVYQDLKLKCLKQHRLKQHGWKQLGWKQQLPCLS